MTAEQILLAICVFFCNAVSAKEGLQKGSVEEYCLKEAFQLQCLKNEVILMTSATYGRMRTGRCITDEEVAAQRRLLAGEEIRLLGCSADVLEILDRKCSGNAECNVRVSDFPDENIQPCFPGLKMYLEASYDCITSADEQRSCFVTASKNPVHIIGSFATDRLCGTKLQPWTIQSSGGQKIRIVLIDFASSLTRKQACRSRGVIFDQEGKKNVSICLEGDTREQQLYISTGNTIKIFLNPSIQQDSQVTKLPSNSIQFLMTVTAFGCSDVIPPEDAWLKRNGDTIVIGCYSSRQTWHLNCKEGMWIGVLGNCSVQNSLVSDSVMDLEQQPTLSNNGEILAMVAIGGFTLAICLAIMSVGAICLRRYYSRTKKSQTYRTLKYHVNSTQSADLRHPTSGTDVAVDSAIYSQDTLQAPTYSLYAGTRQEN